MQQKFTPLDVKPDMFIRTAVVVGRTRLRKNGIGEREKYSAKPRRSMTTLTTFGSTDVVGALKSLAERRHQQRRIVSERLDRFVDGVGLDERFVSLEVDDEVAVERRGHFGDAIGAGCVSRARQPRRRRRNCRTASAMRSSSVATMTASTLRAAAARRYTCSIIGRPAMSASALPGKRVDA